jgi:hypothetical protein
VDRNGHVYVTDVWGGSVIRCEPSCSVVARWGSESSGDEQFLWPYTVVVDGSVLYVGDRGNDRIQVFSLRADEESQLITCPDALTIGCEHACADDPALAAFLGGAAATDNSDPNPVITHDAPKCFPLGWPKVTFTATDAAGDTGACATSVTVVDLDPPDMTAFPSRRLLRLPAAIWLSASTTSGRPTVTRWPQRASWF